MINEHAQYIIVFFLLSYFCESY